MTTSASGRPWDLDRSRGGVSLLQPYVGRGRKREWYRGTADAVLQNLDYIDDRDPELVLILAGDHVYKMDYRPFIALHRARDADLTVAVRRVPLADANRFGILEIGDEGRITRFVEKPANPTSNLVSMGVYAFRWPLLREMLSSERLDFGRDVLPAMVDVGPIRSTPTSTRATGRTSGRWMPTGRRAWISSPTSHRWTSTKRAG